MPVWRELVLKIVAWRAACLKEDDAAAAGKTEFGGNVFFCIGYSTAFGRKPIHSIINCLIKKHDLTWLRPRISFHNFSNLRSSINGDLALKLDADLDCEDFRSRNCNCSGGPCKYDQVCREKLVIYKLV